MNTHIVTRHVALFFAFLLFFVFSTQLAHAQAAAGLQVQPALIEEFLNPGEVHTGVLRATNLSGEDQTYYIITRDVKTITETGAPVFAQRGEATGFEVAEWISLEQTQAVIPAGETARIPYSIRVPANATPGAHLGGIYVSTQSDRPEQTGIGIGYQVGPIVNIRIAGDVVEEARIRSFSAGKFVYGALPVTLTTKIDNLGNVTVSPRGPVDIMDFAGKKVATLTMNEVGSAILPNGTREYEVIWDEAGFYVGRFEAVMSLVYGTEAKQTITRVVSFWVLPPKLVFGVVGTVVVLVLGIVIWTRITIARKVGAVARRRGVRKGVRPGVRRRKNNGLASTVLVLALFAGAGFLAMVFFL